MWIHLLLTLFLILSSCGQKKDSNTLRLNLNVEPPTLDSRKATDASSMNVLLQLFEGLTRMNQDDQPLPAGAETITVSDDKLVYTFHLREHYWSNGDPVTADDYRATWLTILNPQFPAPFAYKLFCIEGAYAIYQGASPENLAVKTLDPKTLQVKLVHPTPYFLELCSLPTFFPVHQQTDKEHPLWAGEGGSTYVCNGPFVLHSWEHESEIILKKNPLYWDAEKVQLAQVKLAMVPDIATEYYMFEMGELDWAGSPLSVLPLEFIPALAKEGKITSYETNGVYYYKLNTEVPPLNNVKVRRALSLSINRQQIIEHLLQANQKVATSLVPGLNHPLFPDGASVRALFEEGLQEEGFSSPPTLTLSYNTLSQHQKIAEAIQQQWKKKLGFEVQLESCDWKVYLAKVSSMHYDIARLGWIGEHHDPISYLESFKTKEHENNETGWENSRFRQLIEASDLELDEKKRLDLLAEAERLLIEEMPIIPIYFLDYAYLKNPAVEGVILSPLGSIDLKEARIAA